MQYYIRAGRIFYAIGMAGLGIQQFIYADFRPVILPEWPAWMHGSPIGAYLSGLAFIIAGILILLNKKAGMVSLLLGGFLLVLFIVFHTPYLLFIIPYSFHLGSWTDALKELALSGGAFVMAGSFIKEDPPANNNYPMRLLEKIIPAGRIFFSITMIAFGIDHFLYTEFVATLVPVWIPGPFFWTYFAAIALIGSGVAIILKIRLKTVGLLLGTMLFLWFIILHIPQRHRFCPSQYGKKELIFH
jgi:uncharacterized membrane protein